MTPHAWQFSDMACWAREVTARLFGPLFRWLLRGPAVSGRHQLAALASDRPLIIAPNHASHLDFSAVRLALGPHRRRRLAAAAAADYWRPGMRWFVAAWLGSFAFDRSGHGQRDSLQAAEGLLARGWSVLVFPEGTRTRTGEIGPFKPGVGLLAIRADAQVLPVRIEGTHAVLPKGARIPHRSRTQVRFGAPLRPGAHEDPRAFTARIEEAVRSL